MTGQLPKDEEEVEKLASSLSRRLEKTRSKIQKRTSELSLIKASPESKNPSVILSCASDDEDVEEKEKKPPPVVRDSLTADPGPTPGRLVRGLRRKLSKPKKKESEGTEGTKDEIKPEPTPDTLMDKRPSTSSDASGGSIDLGCSPPGSEYGSLGSHRGSWSTLLHAIGTAEMIQKVQRLKISTLTQF